MMAPWIGTDFAGSRSDIKQTPWFVVPMLVTGIFLEARSGGGGAFNLFLPLRYLLTVLVVFVTVNFPLPCMASGRVVARHAHFP